MSSNGDLDAAPDLLDLDISAVLFNVLSVT